MCVIHGSTFENPMQIGCIGLILINALQRFANSLSSAQTTTGSLSSLSCYSVLLFGPDMVLYSYRLRSIFRWVACTCVPCFQRELNDTARRTKEQGDLCYFESYIKVSDKALRCGLTVSCEDSAASIAVNYSVNWLNSSDAVRAACLMINWRHVIIENKEQLIIS